MERKTLAELYTDSFVWDAWSVHDPTHGLYHIYFLMADRQDHHPEDRHNMAQVGHATTPSLTIHPDQWAFHGICVAPQTEDETALSSLAIWTGSTLILPPHSSLIAELGGSMVMAITGRSRSDRGTVQRPLILSSSDGHHWSWVAHQRAAFDIFADGGDWYGTEKEVRSDGWATFGHCRDFKILPYPNRDGYYAVLFTAYRAHPNLLPATATATATATMEDHLGGVVGCALTRNFREFEIGPPLNITMSFNKLELPDIVPLGENPLGHNPFGHNPFGANPLRENPLGENKFLLVFSNERRSDIPEDINPAQNTTGTFGLIGRGDDGLTIEYGGPILHLAGAGIDVWRDGGRGSDRNTLPTEYAFTVAEVDRNPSQNRTNLKLLGWRGYDPEDPSIFYGRLIVRDCSVSSIL